MISGLIWGVCESLSLLAGHDVGEYDALFFGGLTYVVAGILFGLLLTPIHMMLRYKKNSAKDDTVGSKMMRYQDVQNEMAIHGDQFIPIVIYK